MMIWTTRGSGTVKMIDDFPHEVSVEVDVEALVRQYAERASKNAGKIVRLAHGTVVIRATPTGPRTQGTERK